MQKTEHIDVAERQDPLRKRYKEAPQEAMVTDWARTRGNSVSDAFHGTIDFGESSGGATLSTQPSSVKDEHYHYNVQLPLGIHRAVGGDHDLPNPGNLLSAALAACFDSTIRMIADRYGLFMESLEVSVSATADTRGTLLVERDVPVAFQRMTCDVTVTPNAGTDPELVGKVMRAAEYSCVNLQTLLSGVPVEIAYEIE